MKKPLIVANLLMLLTFFLRLSYLPPQIPLLYSRTWGEDQLVDTWMIFVLPVLMNSFVFINNFVYKKYFIDNIFVKKIIDYLDLFVAISITLIFLKIIFLVS